MDLYVDKKILLDIKDTISREKKDLYSLKDEVISLRNTDMNDNNQSLYNSVLKRIDKELSKSDEVNMFWDSFFDQYAKLLNKFDYNLDQIEAISRPLLDSLE